MTHDIITHYALRITHYYGSIGLDGMRGYALQVIKPSAYAVFYFVVNFTSFGGSKKLSALSTSLRSKSIEVFTY